MLDIETRQEFLSVVNRFVRAKLMPREAEVAENDFISGDIIAGMRQLGLFGLTIPEEYGGMGIGMEDEVHFAMVLGRTSPAFRSLIGTNNGIGSRSLVLAGTQAQKDAYLPRLASGEIIGAFALTEPDAGSDPASLKTRAVREGQTYRLNGTKRYITNAPEAGLFTVFARTGNSGSHRDISAFLVERGTPGLSIGKADKKMGQSGAHTADVVLEDCIVPHQALLGEVEGRAFSVAMSVLELGRLHIAAVCVGMAERLIADSVAYAGARQQFGKPIIEHQLIQAMLADSQAETLAARTLTVSAAQKADRGIKVTMEASCAKMFASEMLGRVADRAVQIHGGAGYMREYGVERFYRDARLFRIYEGATQIQQLIIAREMMRNG